MTTSSTDARTSAVGTNTAGQQIAFNFPVNDSSDLVVKSRVTATGVEATLTLTTDYTVSVNGSSGGTVTMVAAWATTYEIWIVRATPQTQTLDLTQGGSFNADNIEAALDKIWRALLDVADKVSRCLVVPNTEDEDLDMELPNSVDRASQYLAFDASGEPTVVSSVAPDTATITAWAETLLAAESAAAARTVLGLAIGTNVQAYDADLSAIAALTPADGNVIVGNGSTWVTESGSTLQASLSIPASTDTPLISEIVSAAEEIVTVGEEIVVAS